MKAIILKHPGGPENLVPAELEKPTLEGDEVLVAVEALSINPVDVAVRSSEGALKALLGPQEGEPVILGWDISGTVTEVGSSVTAFKPGDEVFGMVRFPGNGKAYAEYIAAPAAHLTLKPESISHEAAAAATLAALTAWQALVTHAKVQAGEKVVILAAAGGVGHYAVQIAKDLGAFVVGVASGANEAFVRGLGADAFIDYTEQALEDAVNDVDVVLDSVRTPGHLESALQALKPGGRLITITGTLEDAFKAQAEAKNVFAYRMGVKSSGEDMKRLAALLEAGKVKSHVSQTFTFDELPAAHEQVGSGKTRGKVVVKVG